MSLLAAIVLAAASARVESVGLTTLDSRLAVRVVLSGNPGMVAVHREGDVARVSIMDAALGLRFAGGRRFSWTPSDGFDPALLAATPAKLDRLEIAASASEVSLLLHVPPEVSVDARRDARGDGIFEYAEKLRSDPGRKNGLYWETKEGDAPSPLGPVVVQARREGYTGKQSGDKPSPFHGYYYRILKAQGKNAAGSAYDYVVKGEMIGGFAVIASPAKYGNSGVMTFLVNHDGVVYEKDLGASTPSAAAKMTRFDADKTWKKAQ